MPVAPVEFRDQRFTRADLEHLPDDGRRYELIDGVLIVRAAPGRVHSTAPFPVRVVPADLVRWPPVT